MNERIKERLGNTGRFTAGAAITGAGVGAAAGGGIYSVPFAAAGASVLGAIAKGINFKATNREKELHKKLNVTKTEPKTYEEIQKMKKGDHK